eukprot:TRINITY_DN2442_c0_g1_i1.p1 TRINITY_DN2442_c0_g1~~TRINITY_DN2442_c0_g1_i1.p1  ORF type:complete len:545 (+),score=165.99 TRINITY_DN2442_c0_g1_i1:87-1721(+)
MATRRPSNRRTSQRFESNTPDRGQYSRLLEQAGAAAGSNGAAGRRRIFANGALVSSATPGAKVHVPSQKWWFNVDVLHMVFQYVGIHQLFLGRVEDDQQRLFQQGKGEMVRCTAVVCKQWSMSARTLDVVDFRPLRYTMTDVSLAKALSLVRFCKSLLLSECRRVKFQQPSFGMKNLVVLNLVGCSDLTDAALSTMTMEMPKLKELYVPACPKLEKVPVSKPMEGSQLEVLDISANTKVTDEAIERLFADHPKLREFFASQTEKLTNPRISSQTLELLNLDGCENLTFNVALGIMKSCPNLKYVTLGENDTMLEEKSKRFTPLQNIVELNISATFQDDDTINTALDNLPLLKLFDCGNSEFVKKPRLEHQALEVLVMNMCCDLEDTVFEGLGTKMPCLRHVSTNHCDALVRPSVQHPKIQLLDFSNCSALCSDKKASDWIKCPTLKSLYLGHTQHVSDLEVESIVRLHPDLDELNIFQASGVHSPDLSPLKKITTINIMNCWNLDNEWVDNLEKMLPTLGTIFMNIEEEVHDSDPEEGGDPGGW